VPWHYALSIANAANYSADFSRLVNRTRAAAGMTAPIHTEILPFNGRRGNLLIAKDFPFFGTGCFKKKRQNSQQ